MALDVSGSQIYAGRYHYRRSEMPDLFREDVVQSRREKKSIKEQYSVDRLLMIRGVPSDAFKMASSAASSKIALVAPAL